MSSMGGLGIGMHSEGQNTAALQNAAAPRAFVAPPPPPPLVTVRSAGSHPNLHAVHSGGSGNSNPSSATSRGHSSTGSGSTARGSPVTISPTTVSPVRAPLPSPPLHTQTGTHAPQSHTQRSLSPPPPPPPPLNMSAMLLARGGAGSGANSAYPSSVANAGGYSAYPSSNASTTPSSARSAPALWRYSEDSIGSGSVESPMTSVTTPASAREGSAGTWEKFDRAASPLKQSAFSPAQLMPSPASPQGKRERRRLRLHSPVEVDFEADDPPAPPVTPPIHSHPLEDEGEDVAGPDSAVEQDRGWLSALEGEVGEQEMDGVLLSPPTFASADPNSFDPDDDDFDLYDDGYGDDRLDDTIPGGGPHRDRSPSPIRYARRVSVDADIIMSDSSDEGDMSDVAADVVSIDSPAPSVFNDARSTFSRARSTRSRRKRRNTRAAPPPVPLASAAGLARRPRAHSADSSIMGFDMGGLAPSEMWRMEQAARKATAEAATVSGVPVQEMRYVYAAAAARLPASIPPPPALLMNRGSDSAGSLSQYDSSRASLSGHGHGSSESGLRGVYSPSPSTSKSSLPDSAPALSRKETLKMLRKEKKEKEKERAREREREKALRKSSNLPHRSSFSLLRGGSGTANSSAEALMYRGGVERTSTSTSSGGSDEFSRPQPRTNKPTLFKSLYDPSRH
ncbi:hypothetical protein DFH06DRAFT_1219290 [Mycena polygramma]|nr:hypothetical protein DFH06DRAFT_1219290 [Mycena polygramma]